MAGKATKTHVLAASRRPRIGIPPSPPLFHRSFHSARSLTLSVQVTRNPHFVISAEFTDVGMLKTRVQAGDSGEKKRYGPMSECRA
jgi:hypothetical protein